MVCCRRCRQSWLSAGSSSSEIQKRGTRSWNLLERYTDLTEIQVGTRIPLQRSSDSTEVQVGTPTSAGENHRFNKDICKVRTQMSGGEIRRFDRDKGRGTDILCRDQCFGSGSAWIRISFVSWIRIRIPNADPDPAVDKISSKSQKKIISFRVI